MLSQTVACPSCNAAFELPGPFPDGTPDATCPRCGGSVPVAQPMPMSLKLEVDTESPTDGPRVQTNSTVADTHAQPVGIPTPGLFQFLAPAQQADEIGRMGPYRVLASIGVGGMGVVFRAEDPSLQREIALKVMLPQYAADPESKARFLREARAQAKVEHDHIAAIFQVGEDRGIPYITMPLLKGMALQAALRANPRPPLTEVMRIAREVAEGLGAAHGQGLIHRDIKPANVWLDGSRLKVRVLDFGLARVADTSPGAKTQLTGRGVVLGTPAYMSPEQARGRKLDGRTDLFSLGVMLYQMLTGTLPFDGDGTLAILTSLAVDEPPAPILLNPAVPPALSGLTMRLLSKQPEGRPATAEALVAELRAIEAGFVNAVRVVPLVGPSPVVASLAGPDPFDLLDATEANTEVNIPEPKTRATRGRDVAAKAPSGGVPVWAIAAGVLLAVAGVLWFVIDQLTPRPQQLVAAPPEEKPKPAPKPKPPAPVVEPDVRAAEYAVSMGGKVRITGEAREIDRLGDLPRGGYWLTEVQLSGIDQVNDAGLAAFKDCKHLTVLALQLTKATDASMAYFKDCKDLRSLDVCGAQITDAGFAHFKDCKSLETLWFATTKITDAGVALFKDCKEVVNVNLYGTQITDAGLDVLKGYPRLRYLEVRETRVTGRKVEEIAAMFPRCKIEWNGGTIQPREE